MPDELTYILLLAIVCAIMMCCGMLAGIHDVLRNIDYELNISNQYKLYHDRTNIQYVTYESECTTDSDV